MMERLWMLLQWLQKPWRQWQRDRASARATEYLRQSKYWVSKNCPTTALYMVGLAETDLKRHQPSAEKAGSDVTETV